MGVRRPQAARRYERTEGKSHTRQEYLGSYLPCARTLRRAPALPALHAPVSLISLISL